MGYDYTRSADQSGQRTQSFAGKNRLAVHMQDAEQLLGCAMPDNMPAVKTGKGVEKDMKSFMNGVPLSNICKGPSEGTCVVVLDNIYMVDKMSADKAEMPVKGKVAFVVPKSNVFVPPKDSNDGRVLCNINLGHQKDDIVFLSVCEGNGGMSVSMQKWHTGFLSMCKLYSDGDRYGDFSKLVRDEKKMSDFKKGRETFIPLQSEKSARKLVDRRVYHEDFNVSDESVRDHVYATIPVDMISVQNNGNAFLKYEVETDGSNDNGRFRTLLLRNNRPKELLKDEEVSDGRKSFIIDLGCSGTDRVSFIKNGQLYEAVVDNFIKPLESLGIKVEKCPDLNLSTAGFSFSNVNNAVARSVQSVTESAKSAETVGTTGPVEPVDPSLLHVYVTMPAEMLKEGVVDSKLGGSYCRTFDYNYEAKDKNDPAARVTGTVTIGVDDGSKIRTFSDTSGVAKAEIDLGSVNDGHVYAFVHGVENSGWRRCSTGKVMDRLKAHGDQGFEVSERVPVVLNMVRAEDVKKPEGRTQYTIMIPCGDPASRKGFIYVKRDCVSFSRDNAGNLVPGRYDVALPGNNVTVHFPDNNVKPVSSLKILKDFQDFRVSERSGLSGVSTENVDTLSVEKVGSPDFFADIVG